MGPSDARNTSAPSQAYGQLYFTRSQPPSPLAACLQTVIIIAGDMLRGGAKPLCMVPGSPTILYYHTISSLLHGTSSIDYPPDITRSRAPLAMTAEEDR